MRKLLLLCFALLFALGAHAQERAVSGKVTSSEDGSPVPGANVVLKGTTNGTVTDATGAYKLTVPSTGGTLVISFIGMLTIEAVIGERSVVDGALGTDVKQLSEVVVTALGEKVDKDKFASSVSTVQGGSVAKSGETSAVQGLSGKASGVLITRNAGDPGAGAYIQIRGQNTINGNAQPLFIVDGIPVSNSSDGVNNTITQQSRINDINPEDIASMEVLKGASAAALWGTRAANGVIMITTKKGKDSGGKVNISFKSTVSFDKVNKVHPLQRAYGQGTGGRYAQSNRNTWGDRIEDRTGGADTYITAPGQYYTLNSLGLPVDSYAGYVTLSDGTARYAIPAGGSYRADGTQLGVHGGKNSKDTWDHNEDAFRTGYFTDNNFTISGGNAKTIFLLSYSNLDQKGTVKNFSDYKRNTARVNVSSQFTDWLKASANIGYTNSFSTRIQQGDNLDGLYLGGLRTSPDFDNTYYQGTYTDAAGTNYPGRHVAFRNALGQNVNPIYSNPLWNINNNKNTTDVDRILGNLELSIDPLSWLNITGRAGIDNFIDNRLEKFPVTSASYDAGYLSKYWITEKQFNTDVFARASKSFGANFSTNLMVGVNYNSRRKAWLYGQITNFTVAQAPEILTNATLSDSYLENYNSLIRTYAYYAQADFQGYDQLFVTLTGRSESASTFGTKVNNSFFFPSTAVAWQFTKLDALNSNPILSFGKLRFTWGQVGIQPQPYLGQTVFNSGSFPDSYASTLRASSAVYGGGYSRSLIAGNEFLKPERKTETEIGFDLRFLQDRITLGATAYTNNTKDVILSLNTPSETGFNIKNLNAAELANKGIEIELGADILPSSKSFGWNISANYSINRNKVVSLAGSEAQTLPDSYQQGASLIEGQPFGVFFSTDFLKDEGGNYILDANGFPQGGTESEIIGNPNYGWRGGLGNTFTYKGLSLYVLLDLVQGNDFYNGTRGALYSFGVHGDQGDALATQNLRTVDGKTIAAGTHFQGSIKDFGAGPVALTQAWYADRGTAFTNASYKQFIEDGSVTRLREVTLSYSLRSAGFRSATKLSSIDFSITGRNLALWTKYTGVDPEINISGAGLSRGQDWFNNPNTKSLLFSIKINY
ncbi:MAG TPA: SusC/RagA family TonB-linked outer membrane protein [Cyclobacteriaceae bacterium]